MTSERFDTYEEFWPHYLREHGRPATRNLHFFGTALAIVLLVMGIVTLSLWLILAAIVSGYAFAWIGHAFVERNRPATFTHPVWSLVSDFRMFALWIGGRLATELDRAGVEPEA